MQQVITIGSALVDIFIHSDQFQARQASALQPGQAPTQTADCSSDINSGAKPRLLCQAYGDKLEVDSFNVYTGGGGSNTAVAFARAGFTTSIICETGRDHFASLVTADLSNNQVKTKLVIAEKKEQTGGSVILVGQDGERTVLVHRGAASQLDTFDIASYWLVQADWIHLSSIAGRLPVLKKIFQLVAKSPSCQLSWNPGKAELALLTSRQLSIKEVPVQIFIVNQQEWELIADVQNQILRQVPQVIVTNAEQGGRVYLSAESGQQAGQRVARRADSTMKRARRTKQGREPEQFHFPASGVKAVDTTGAGDAFCAGYVTGQLWGKTPRQSVQLGVANAASVIQFYGAKAGLLTKQRLQAILTQTQKPAQASQGSFN
jgi:ribokinase